jgi:hypothetical protein
MQSHTYSKCVSNSGIRAPIVLRPHLSSDSYPYLFYGYHSNAFANLSWVYLFVSDLFRNETPLHIGMSPCSENVPLAF